MMHFKKIGSLLVAIFVLFQFSAVAQDSAAVKWQATGKKIAEGQYEIKFTGTIKAGWHVYTKTNPLAVEGPKITFSDSAIQKTGDQVLTGNLKTIEDKIFEALHLEIAEDHIEIVQKIRLLGVVPAKLKAVLLYNTANNDAFIPEENKIDIDSWN